jgi:hypothetical protein
MGRKSKEYSKEELINNLKIKYEELGKRPIMADMSNPFPSAYLRVFKTWRNALKEAGLDKATINKKTILENILTGEKSRLRYNKCICCGQPSNGLIMKGNQVRSAFCKNCYIGKLIELPKGQRFEYFR